jgi:hypothetical protein|tara:strand:+ start:3713 stop:4186 length:474 start_codon:yes stop_codon:yes gene_type:complete
MADKAITNFNTLILPDRFRASLSGYLNYEPLDTTEKWVFVERDCGSSSSDLISNTQVYFGSSQTISTSDKVKWIIIKNMSTTSTDGICICLDGGTAAWNLVDGIFIGASEVLVLKPSNTTSGNLHHIRVTLDSNGIPSGTSSSSFNVQIAAILDDVS